ncbi:hypothetical protein PVAG01_10899 [Phlyctema vagabunda]|uniref:D-xylulose reductase n=1 Tax=Phlyctema vagabunda TaxID=108571 RepID=A0ABR4P3K7_9HELO
MGHETSGTIHKVGSRVTTLQPGDRVAIEPGLPCQRCKTCQAGSYNLCPSMEFAACPPKSHGTLRKYYKSTEGFCYKLSDDIGLDEGVLLEPLAVAVHAARLAKITFGKEVVVFGAGTIGLLCAAVSKAFGAKSVTVVDINGERLDFAKNYVDCNTYQISTELQNESSKQIASHLKEKYGLGRGGGADTVLEATGNEKCLETGIDILRPGGNYVQVGMGKDKIQFPFVLFIQKELHISGCFRYNAGDFEIARDLVDSKKISVRALISSVEPFETASEAWEKTRKGSGIKNLIRGPVD